MPSENLDLSFDELELSPKILQGVKSCGINIPTDIQAKSIPAILDGFDVMGASKTGSGKTAAFLLPILDRLLNEPKTPLTGARALVLCPTRELAQQTLYQAKQLGKLTDLNYAAVIGGVSYDVQDEALDNKPDLIISTPGRLQELIRTKSIDLMDIEYLVLDEADRMLDMGFAGEVLNIVNHCPEDRQTMLFSATLDSMQVRRIAKDIMVDPQVFEVDTGREAHQSIEQYIHLADDLEHKRQILVHLLGNKAMHAAIIFVKTKERAQQLGVYLREQKVQHEVLYGDLKQKTRQYLLSKFRNGVNPVLVATDVAARGLDVLQISHVINYDMPRNADVYVHRIGRTGRAGQTGTAISIVEAHDIDMLYKVERFTNNKLPRKIIKTLRPQNKEAKPSVKKKKKKAK
jgi:ATP-dependent RNA helicase SrmB